MAEYVDTHISALEALKQLAERVTAGYTTKAEHKTLSDKVDGLVTAGGEPNKIESIKVNGTAQNIAADKSVDITVPTNNNQLQNGAGYQTASDVDTAVKNAFKTFEEAVTADDTVNTYKELIEWAAEHGSEAAEIVGQIAELEAELEKKVDKVTGKQLSTNDFDNDAKNKLAGLENYVHPDSTIGAKSEGFYKITTDKYGHVIGATEVTKEDITKLGIPGSDTTYNPASSSENGLMSKEDKIKLDSMIIATPAEVKAMLDEVFGA